MDTFSYKGSVYRFVYARGQRPNEKIPIIYREQGDSCWVVWADPGGDAVGLSDGVPRPVAIAFSKATIKRMMAKKGETWMLEWFGKRETIAPEDAAALKSLGYPLPDRIKILPWGKPERETLVNEKY